MWDFLWNLRQQFKINEPGRRAARGESSGRDGAADALEARVDSLTLTCMAMWSILEEEFGVTEKQLAARIEEIDQRDGNPDGRVSPTLVECPSCSRRMSTRHRHCIYCGAEGLKQGALSAR